MYRGAVRLEQAARLLGRAEREGGVALKGALMDKGREGGGWVMQGGVRVLGSNGRADRLFCTSG